MSLLGKIGRAIVGGAAGYAQGGPAGAVIGALGSFATPPTPSLAAPAPQFMSFVPPAAGTAIRFGGAALNDGRALRTLPGAGQGRVRLPPQGRGGDRGTRGGNGGGTTIVPVPIPYRTGGRRYRRQNPCNVKALRRAIRRVKAFRKISHSIEMMLPKRKATPVAHAHRHAHRK